MRVYLCARARTTVNARTTTKSSSHSNIIHGSTYSATHFLHNTKIHYNFPPQHKYTHATPIIRGPAHTVQRISTATNTRTIQLDISQIKIKMKVGPSYILVNNSKKIFIHNHYSGSCTCISSTTNNFSATAPASTKQVSMIICNPSPYK